MREVKYLAKSRRSSDVKLDVLPKSESSTYTASEQRNLRPMGILPVGLPRLGVLVLMVEVVDGSSGLGFFLFREREAITNTTPSTMTPTNSVPTMLSAMVKLSTTYDKMHSTMQSTSANENGHKKIIHTSFRPFAPKRTPMRS